MQEINVLVFIGVAMMLTGGIGICVSLILTFKWKVFDILDELSGKKAKRQIQRLRELNVGSGSIEGLSTSEVYQLWGSGSINLNSRVFDNFDEAKKDGNGENKENEKNIVENKSESKDVISVVENKSSVANESQVADEEKNTGSDNESNKELTSPETDEDKEKEKKEISEIESKESGNGVSRKEDDDFDDDEESSTSDVSRNTIITVIEELTSI